jgi:hypothetical protein
MGADNSLIRCICGLTEDDGFTIACEQCNAWEHALCFGFRDELKLPEVFMCELCDPRPLKFTPEQARGLQLQARAHYEARRGVATEDAEQKKRSRTKPRPRTSETKETPDPAAEESVDSPGGMGPPASKPKRRSQPGKPRSVAASLKDGTEDEDYFRVLPWELEYTPLKDNLLRGRASRQAMTLLYHEWAEEEEEEKPRKRRPVIHDSGLPSPTETGLRLSPDTTFLSPPDFSILAPPVPPVFLSGSALDALAAPTTIRHIEESASMCYLPLKYMEPNSGIYPRPALYGLFTMEAVSTGGFLGELRGEIVDAASYRQDPVNQYSALGVPKPYVRSIGPPVNLMIDARSYGNELRFIRSGCHPNAVLRPLFFRADDSATPKLRFGVFAARELNKNEEIVLGWEWDDQHVVHTLRAVIDSTLKNSANKPGIPANVIELLGTKFDAILTNIFGTFQSCACTVTTDCAFAQMRRLVNGQTFHGVSGQRARKRIDLGELLGAVRGWRRRELEEAAAAKARQYRSSNEWEAWRTGKEDVEELERDQEREDEEEVEAEEEEAEVEQPEEEPVEDDAMDIEEPIKAPEAPEPAEVDPNETDDEMAAPSVAVSVSSPVPDANAMEVDEPAPAPPALLLVKEEAEDMTMVEPVTPITSTAPPAPPSSALSSLPQDEPVDDDLSGNESEATTMTVILTASEAESEAEVDVRPATTRRGRRVLSPSGDSSHGSTPTKKTARARQAPAPQQPASTPPRPANKRRMRKNVIASSDDDSSADESEPVASPKPSPSRRRPAPSSSKSAVSAASVGKKRKAVSDSESEKENGRQRKIEKVDKAEKVEREDRERERERRSEKKAEVERERERERPRDRKGKDKERTDRTDRVERTVSGAGSKRDAKPDSKDKAKRADSRPDSKDSSRIKPDSRIDKEEPERERRKDDKRARKDKAEKVDKAEKAEKADKIDKADKAEREPEDKAKETEAADKDKAAKPDSSKSNKDKAAVAKPETVEAELASSKPTSKASEKASEPASEPAPSKAPVAEKEPPVPAPAAEKEAAPDAIATTEAATETQDKTPVPEVKPELQPEPKVKEPPKEPAVPPKKVSMKEYLATHKIRKHTAPEPAASAPAPASISASDDKPKPKDKDADETPTPAPTSEVDIKPTIPATPASNARLNLFEHLPSARPSASPSTPSAPRSLSLTTSTPSTAFVPRERESRDSLTPSATFAPRRSPSFVPRNLEDAPPPFPPAYGHDGAAPAQSPIAPRAALPPHTPPHASHSLPELPPALGARDGPPHAPLATPNANPTPNPAAAATPNGTPGYGPRAPPTGPRVPPTGPRAGWVQPAHTAHPAPNVRPPFAPPRGPAFRGGWRPRGVGFRGRGRGGM